MMFIQVYGREINYLETGEWMEWLMTTSFSLRVNFPRPRVWLMDKRNSSSVSVKEAKAFKKKFYLESLEQKIEKAGKVYFISDGATWLKKLKADYFPQAVGVLDIWHLEGKLNEALGEERRKGVERLKFLVLEGRT